jgi:hypothetical protein
MAFGSNAAQIVVEYVARTEGLSKASSDIEQGGSKISKTMQKVGGAVAAGFAVAAVVDFGKKSVEAARDSEKATNRLEQVFRSMGDTTGEAAKAAEEYASKLSRQIGVEDEAIMAAQAILATFGKVSDETARTAGVFDRATAAAADLAAAGFGSMEQNAVQLGKALQDPVKGINSLARSGVTFTEQEKAKIKALVDSNRQLEAQQLVLAAIEKQVKGTGAATADEADKAAIAYGELQESIGKLLLPVIEALAPVLAKVADFLAQNSEIIVPLVAGIGAAVTAIKLITVAQIAWNIAMGANPIGAVILAIGALVAAGVLLYKNWDKVTAAANAMWRAIKTGALAVFDWLKANWPLIVGILTGPFGLAIALTIKHWDKIKSVVSSAVDAIAKYLRKPGEAVESMLATIKRAVGSIADAILGQLGRISNAIARVVDAIKRPINAVLGAWNAITFTLPKISVPGVKVAGKQVVPDVDFGGQSFGVPKIPLLAGGGVVSSPTLLVAGEGRGREIIAPEALLRSIIDERPLEVRVFIGDTELRGLVRSEVVKADTGLARTLLAGGRA